MTTTKSQFKTISVRYSNPVDLCGRELAIKKTVRGTFVVVEYLPAGEDLTPMINTFPTHADALAFFNVTNDEILAKGYERRI